MAEYNMVEQKKSAKAFNRITAVCSLQLTALQLPALSPQPSALSPQPSAPSLQPPASSPQFIILTILTLLYPHEIIPSL